MLTINKIRERLQDRNHAAVGRALGLTGAYISAIARGKRVNPSCRVLEALSAYLEAPRDDND